MSESEENQEQVEEFEKKQKIIIEHKGLSVDKSEREKELELELEEKKSQLSALALAEFEKQRTEVADSLGISKELITDTTSLESYKAELSRRVPSGYATREPPHDSSVYSSTEQLISDLAQKAQCREASKQAERKKAEEMLNTLLESMMKNPNFSKEQAIATAMHNTFLCNVCGFPYRGKKCQRCHP